MSITPFHSIIFYQLFYTTYSRVIMEMYEQIDIARQINEQACI